MTLTSIKLGVEPMSCFSVPTDTGNPITKTKSNIGQLREREGEDERERK